jgi:cell fate (sporulation/competence/biofilm development) regulator YmcA (YheA/YmcA/DUF963 family)
VLKAKQEALFQKKRLGERQKMAKADQIIEKAYDAARVKNYTLFNNPLQSEEALQKIHQFKKERQKMGRNFKKFLFKYNLERVKDFEKFFTAIQKEVKQGAKDTHEMLGGFRKDFDNMKNIFQNFASDMQRKRESQPFGHFIGTVSSFRGRQPEPSEEVKSGKTFKVKTKKKKGERIRPKYEVRGDEKHGDDVCLL